MKAVMKKLKFWTSRLYKLRGWHYTLDHINVFFYFFNWLDSYYVRSNEVIKILPSQLQRVNMSHSSFFQQDLLAVFVFNVGPCNAMFYDVVRRQCDRLLCSVEKEKNLVKYKICVLRSLSALGLLLVFWTSMLLNFVFWYSVDQQLLVSIIIIFPSPSTSFTDKCREGNIFSCKGYYST